MAEIIDPDLPICDPHIHLINDILGQYLIEDAVRDVQNSGHNVVHPIYMECGNWYRETGPEIMRPVGEVEYVVAQNERAGFFAGLIAFAELRLGDGVQEVLDSIQDVAGSRLRGIRFGTAWDPDPAFCFEPHGSTQGMLRDDVLQRGAAAVGRLGLPLDCFVFSHQLLDVVAFAQALPEQIIVVDHLGTPLVGMGRSRPTSEVMALWRQDLHVLAGCENVRMKLGGIGMEMQGAPWAPRITEAGWDRTGISHQPTAEEVADFWRGDVTFCIDTFGPERCMFESNFPIDRQTFDYSTSWNAFKLMAASYSAAERLALFHDTAAETYGLPALARDSRDSVTIAVEHKPK
jgi:L-fuconolactonase